VPVNVKPFLSTITVSPSTNPLVALLPVTSTTPPTIVPLVHEVRFGAAKTSVLGDAAVVHQPGAKIAPLTEAPVAKTTASAELEAPVENTAGAPFGAVTLALGPMITHEAYTSTLLTVAFR